MLLWKWQNPMNRVKAHPFDLSYKRQVTAYQWPHVHNLSNCFSICSLFTPNDYQWPKSSALGTCCTIILCSCSCHECSQPFSAKILIKRSQVWQGKKGKVVATLIWVRPKISGICKFQNTASWFLQNSNWILSCWMEGNGKLQCSNKNCSRKSGKSWQTSQN